MFDQGVPVRIDRHALEDSREDLRDTVAGNEDADYP